MGPLELKGPKMARVGVKNKDEQGNVQLGTF